MADGSAPLGQLERVGKEIPVKNNRVMVGLCGPLDKNLTLFEQQLNVILHRRGNIITVEGLADDVRAAMLHLTGLMRRIEAGQDIDPAEGVRPASPLDCPALITRGKSVDPRTQMQREYLISLHKNELNLGIGPAGTGKTYLAVAVGVSLLLQGAVDRIILSRPAVEAGERLGFLPGDMKEKVDPYMQPLYDALADMLPAKVVQKHIEEKKIEIAPLAFMRGRTLSNAYVLLDEAQNATEMQMRMFLTRLGQGSRMTVTGDPSQVDLPRGVGSGLVQAQRILEGVQSVGITRFTGADVVRHPLVARILAAYDADSA